jgi:multidrug efflux pump subunit AcrA (membrane-fusion protein)
MRTLETEQRLAELALVEAEERRRIAVLEVDRARARLELRRIASPFDGVVTARHRNPGELVDATTPVLTVARIHPLRVETIVPVEHLGRIAPGSEAVVISAAPGAPSLRAVVERVDPVVDPASHTFGVRLALPNPDGRIAAGVRCHVRFER